MAASIRSCFRLIITGALFTILLPVQSWGQIYFDTKEDSRLWLEGSSTVHRFDCVARSIQGTAYIEGLQPDAIEGSGSVTMSGGMPDTAEIEAEELQNVREKLHVHLKIPVESFDCRHSRMNRDMYRALKSDTYDYISFEFEDAETLPNDGSIPGSLFDDGYQPFRIQGVLNVAGVDRDVELIVRGRTEGEGSYRIKGQKEISMKDYEIEPPTALRGLIRAHDDLTVFFELHVTETGRD
jgi:hypothetical protein